MTGDFKLNPIGWLGMLGFGAAAWWTLRQDVEAPLAVCVGVSLCALVAGLLLSAFAVITTRRSLLGNVLLVLLAGGWTLVFPQVLQRSVHARMLFGHMQDNNASVDQLTAFGKLNAEIRSLEASEAAAGADRAARIDALQQRANRKVEILQEQEAVAEQAQGLARLVLLAIVHFQQTWASLALQQVHASHALAHTDLSQMVVGDVDLLIRQLEKVQATCEQSLELIENRDSLIRRVTDELEATPAQKAYVASFLLDLQQSDARTAPWLAMHENLKLQVRDLEIQLAFFRLVRSFQPPDAAADAKLTPPQTDAQRQLLQEARAAMDTIRAADATPGPPVD